MRFLRIYNINIVAHVFLSSHVNRKTQYANPVIQAKEDSRRINTNRSTGKLDLKYSTTLPRSARSSQNSIQAPPSRAFSDPDMQKGGQENGPLSRTKLPTSSVKTTSGMKLSVLKI